MGQRVNQWMGGFQLGRVAGALLAAGLAMPATAQIEREGEGSRRQSLDAMELKDAPSGLWGSLSNWSTDGKASDALDAAKLAGKPVLVLTWATWSKPSLREALPLATKLAANNPDLVVIAAHSAQGWDAAAGATAGTKVVLAQDAKGEFRKGLGSDSDPDFYVFDRAGHMRYADIATPSVIQAVEEVVAETKEQAADVEAIKAARAGKGGVAGTVSITDIDPEKLPLVPPGYRQPTEDEYNKADWPKFVDVPNVFQFEQVNGEVRYPTIALAAKKTIKTGREAPQGRATVMYLWHPEVPATFDVMDRMDVLQQQNQRDLNVIGAAILLKKIDSGRAGQISEETDIERLTKGFDAFVQKRNSKHTLALDTDLSSTSGMGESSYFPIAGVPCAVIASSDGTIRWAGAVNTSEFTSAIENVLRNDPGIRNRRSADKAFLQSKR